MKKKKKHSSIPFDLAKGKIAMREEMERKKKGEGKTKTVCQKNVMTRVLSRID